MPSFDEPVQPMSLEVATATEAAHVASLFQRQQQRFKRITAASRNHREELAAMVLELQTNGAILDELANWYGVFVFTGGHVPRAKWNLLAITSYLEHPLAADCLSTSEIQRYRHLAQAISELGQAGEGPKTLRCRHGLGDEFGQAASETRVLRTTLELSVTKAMGEVARL